MRNRKVLAFVLALAMVITLIPGAAFAGSTNTVDRVTTVAPDNPIPTVTLYLEADQLFTSTAQAIKLSLTNAEWAMGSAQIKSTPQAILTTGAATTAAIGPSIGLTSGAPGLTANAISITQTTAEFAIVTTNVLTKGSIIALTLELNAGSEEGEVKVTIDRLDSNFSSGTYTVAIVGDGKTTATVVGTPTTSWRGSFIGNVIEIRENAVNSVDTTVPERLRLTLPAGMSWNGVTVGGNLVNNSTATASSIDGRDLYLDVDPTPDNAVRQVLTITPDIYISKDAKLGDVTVAIRNGDDISNAAGLVVGVYVEENVKVYTVKDADLPEIIAGREYSDDDGGTSGNEPYEIEITVEEEMASALVSSRFIEFEFPDYVQIVTIATNAGVEVIATGNYDSTAGSGSYPAGSGWDNAVGALNRDTSSFEYTLPNNLSTSVKEKFVFVIPVTVEAGTPAGDLTVKVSGAKAGIAETDLVVGKILEPVSVEVKMADIRAGIQKQALGEIIIKENFAGALMEDDLAVAISTDIRGSIKDYNVEVLSGDIELDEDGIDTATSSVTGLDNALVIPIDRQSVKTPGEIKISGITFSVDRTPAEGKYGVGIRGEALVTNGDYNKGTFSDAVKETAYINVITLADANLYGEAEFVIGATEYQVYINGVLETRTMDAPAYIDTANRTMVPIRFAANSLGVSDNNILWDQNTKTATIMKGDRVILIPVGKNYLMVNGAQLPMNTVPVNNGGRVFVPIAYLSTALGASYTWDDATKTVTIINQ